MASADESEAGVPAADGRETLVRSFPVALAAALLLGLALRLWFIWRLAHIAGDALVYGDIAQNVLRHHVYGFTRLLNGVAVSPRPTLIRLPGYPLFLALCFRLFGMERYYAVLLVQAAFDLWTCVLLGGIARRLFGLRAGMTAVWLGALCPFTANYVAAPLTETLTLFTIGLAFYGLVRWRESGAGLNRWVYCTGAALAYAVLLRPEQGMLPAVLVPAMLWVAWRGRRGGGGSALSRAMPVVLAAVLTVLPLGPWAVRNWRTFHVFQPLAPRYANDPGEPNPDGFQRWFRTWGVDFISTDDCYWQYDGSPIQIADLPNRAFDSNAQYAATDALLNDYNQNQVATQALDGRFDAIGWERIKADPLRYYVEMPVARVADMALRPRTEMLPVVLEWWKPRGHVRQSLFAAAYAGLNLAYLVLAAMTLARRRLWAGNGVVVWAMVAMVFFRCALLATIDNSEARYTLEFFPVLIALAAATVGKWGFPVRKASVLA